VLRTAISGQAVRNSHALVVDGIGRAIVAGDFGEGVILPGDAELAGRFAVSRTVLREAMKTLAAKGMIVARARIGTRVTGRSTWNFFDADVLRWYLELGPDRAFLHNLSEMRLSFEPYAARLACSRATPQDIARMMAHAEAMAVTTQVDTFTVADLDFHIAVLEASKNPFMYSVGALIEAALVTSFRLSSPIGLPGGQQHTAAKHRRIAEAIAANQPDAAADAMVAVIEEGRVRLEAKLPGQDG